jgi:AcrR family transcriptional regulator
MNQVRREPRQQRSKDRVEQILAAASEIIGEGGIDALTMSSISERSGIPVPTVYRYFADRDEIAAAFLDVELEKIEQAIAMAFLSLKRVTVRSLIETSVFAHLEHHQSNPQAIGAWFGTPRAPVVYERVKRQDEKMGDWFRSVASETGLLELDDLPHGEALLVELGDRTFEWVFSQSLSKKKQREFVGRFVDMLASYLERFATPAGLEGIPGPVFLAALAKIAPASRK